MLFCILGYLEKSINIDQKWAGETARHMFWQKYECGDTMLSMVTVIFGLCEMAPCVSLCSPPSTLFFTRPPHPLLTLHVGDDLIYHIGQSLLCGSIWFAAFSLHVSALYLVKCSIVFSREWSKKKKESSCCDDSWHMGWSYEHQDSLVFFYFEKAAHYADFVFA